MVKEGSLRDRERSIGHGRRQSSGSAFEDCGPGVGALVDDDDSDGHGGGDHLEQVLEAGLGVGVDAQPAILEADGAAIVRPSSLTLV